MTEIPIQIEIVDEDSVDESVSPEDWAPAPEFSDFDVWCSFSEDWAATWRPDADSPWFCRDCGATDHTQRDTEEA